MRQQTNGMENFPNFYSKVLDMSLIKGFESPSYAVSIFLGLDFWSENSSQCNCLVCSPSEGPLSPTPAFVHLL